MSRVVIDADETIQNLSGLYRERGMDPNEAIREALHREAKRLSRRKPIFFDPNVGGHMGGHNAKGNLAKNKKA